jgi:hypothetical protein
MNMEAKTKMLVDIANGVPAPAKEGKEEKAYRAKLTSQIDAIKEKGGIVDVPAEMP